MHHSWVIFLGCYHNTVIILFKKACRFKCLRDGEVPNGVIYTTVAINVANVYLCLNNSFFGQMPAFKLILEKSVSHFISLVFHLRTNNWGKK